MIFSKISRIDTGRSKKIQVVLLFCVWYYFDIWNNYPDQRIRSGEFPVCPGVWIGSFVDLFYGNVGSGRYITSVDRVYHFPAVKNNELQRSRLV